MSDDKKSILDLWRTPIMLVVILLVLIFVASVDYSLGSGIAQILGGAWALWYGYKWISNR